MSHRLLFTLIVFLAVANILIWSLLGVEKAYADRVYPGVWIHAQPLAGLTKAQVIDRLEPVNKAMLLQPITLKLVDKEYRPTLADLGYRVDTAAMADAALLLGRGRSVKDIALGIIDYRKSRSIPVIYDIDQVKFDSYLNEIGQSVAKSPKNIAVTYQDGKLIITPAENGIALDREELKTAITREARPGKAAVITLGYRQTTPEITDESQITDVQAHLTKLLAGPLRLQAEDVTQELTPAELYALLYFDVKENKLTVSPNSDKVQALVSGLAKKVDRKAVTRQVSAVNSSVINEGQDGRQLDVPDSTKRITERLTKADIEAPVVLKVDKIDRTVVTISPEYVLGRHAGRYIEVDLSAQRMHLLEGEQYHRTFIISTGKWSTPTPIGDFTIKNHIGVAWSNRFGLYMPNWMGLQTADTGFYDGYGIHGLPYWPNGAREGENHLGRPVSHGCIRLGADDITYLYDWAPNGTPVTIHQ